MTVHTGRHPLPTELAVQDLLGRLFERSVTVSRVDALPPQQPVVCAVYRDDGERLAGMVLADLAFANGAGAALGLVPPAWAAHVTPNDAVDSSFMEHYREVANVASRWFNGDDWPHVVLASVHGPREPTPPGTMVFRVAPRARRDYAVTVDGYGDGLLSVLSN